MLQGFVQNLLVAIAATVIPGAAGQAAGEAPAAAPRPRAVEMKPDPAAADDDAADRPAGRVGYLGIVIGAVSEELRAQLDLPEKAGLVITKVAPGSPAAKAGLEPHDILLAFGGREVSSPLEITELVQATKNGKRVRLVIVRRGKQRKVDVVIESREPVAGEDGRPAGFPGPQPGNLDGLPPLMQRQMLQGQLGAAIAQGLAQGQAGGAGSTRMQTSSMTINGHTQTTTVSSDESGTIEIHGNDGKRTVSIRGADGKEVHAGPLDREADFDSLPEPWREKVRRVEAGSRGIAPGAGRGPGNPF